MGCVVERLVELFWVPHYHNSIAWAFFLLNNPTKKVDVQAIKSMNVYCAPHVKCLLIITKHKHGKIFFNNLFHGITNMKKHINNEHFLPYFVTNKGECGQ